MHRIFSIATVCILGLSVVALGKGDNKHSSSSKGNSGNSSKGTQQVPSGKKSQQKDGKEKDGKTGQTSGNHGKQQGPKNPNPPKSRMPKRIPERLLRGVANNPKVGSGARGALGSVLDGNFLDANGRQDLNNLLAGNPAGLNEDELKAVQAVLDFDALVKKEERFLQVENASGERVTLWLHYQSLADKDQWDWLPVAPVDVEKALRFVLEPNSKVYLNDGKARIAAGRARLWAESESGYKWSGYRDQDLKLKPTAEKQEVREMGTYSLRLAGHDSTQTQARK